jgi:HEAT repeat protein
MRAQPAPSEQEAVVNALRHFGAAAVPDIVLMLRDQDAEVRLGALWAFFVIGPAPRQVLPDLVWIAAKDDNDDVRTMAAWVASGWLVGGPPADSLPALITAVQGADAELRHKAAHWIALVIKAHNKRIDPHLTGQVVPLLADALREVDIDIRREIIATLGAMGPRAKAAIPELRRLVRDADASRREAAAALRSIEGR